MRESHQPTCPYCDYEYDDEETWYPKTRVGKASSGDCDVSKIRCHNDDCKKWFYVMCIHEIKWDSRTDDDF